MDLREIKEIIRADGGKFIIIEDDEPVFVIMGFEDFKKKTLGNGNPVRAAEIIEPKGEKAYQQKTSEVPPELEDEPLKIEDIPF